MVNTTIMIITEMRDLGGLNLCGPTDVELLEQCDARLGWGLIKHFHTLD